MMMDDLRLAALAARVVAWHNRHPLARRISAAHVHAVGYVALPFVGAAGANAPALGAAAPREPAAAGEDAERVDLGALEAGSLRERALARARQQATGDASTAAPGGPAGVAPPVAEAALPALATLQPDFSEDFIDPLRPSAVARFAARAGQVLVRPPGDGPVREVPADGAHPGRQPARVYLLTAVIETGTRKSRVLLGTGLTPPVLGRRIFDGTRMAAVAVLAGVVVGVPAWLLQPADTPPQAPQAAAPAPDSPASAASAADAPGVLAAAPLSTASAAPADVASSALPVGAAKGSTDAPAADSMHAGQGAASAAAPAAAIAPGRPAAHAGGAPSIRPVISEEDKARARQAREALAASRQAAAPARPETPPPGAASAPDTAGKPAPPPAPASPAAQARAQAQPRPVPAATAALPASGPAAYALSTRPLRTRAEAEQVQVAMRSLLRTVGAVDVKVDVLPQGDDWRVVALTFPQRAAADKARTLLVSRGMRVEVIDF